jgi:hypothetical protein
MNYEKAYKEALERARTIHNEHHAQCHDVMTKVFPELAESEGERIRKAIKSILAFSPAALFDKVSVSREDAITWLEKQGEQKITNSKEDIDFTIYYPLKNGNGKYECIPYSFYGSLTSFSDNDDLIDFLRNCFYTKQKCEDWIKKHDERRPSWSAEDEYQINTILHGLDLKREIYKKKGNKAEEDRYNTQYNWLKSLKYRIKGE